MHGYDNYIELKLPPMTTIYLKQKKTEGKTSAKKKTSSEKHKI